MRVEQKEACCIFFVPPPPQLFHCHAGVIAVAADRFRHDCVRIRALCNEI